ncbi:hypothetical protein JCM7686_1786 [Paracoccus aminophilus JCM 7686]|uniref:Uncharacterized protein n=2 Tax=Paracoccus aminophilus TaxID=34003 RepID=S5XUJ7_PARAH|nr:hypothetical protein JCM7686_1786 [Paracoccus aminophilus JCM 7686]
MDVTRRLHPMPMTAHLPLPARLPKILIRAAVLLSLALPLRADPAAPEIWAPRMAEAYLALMDAPQSERAAVEDGMRRLIASYGPVPALAENAPAAFVQAARLAREAETPATRGVMYDLARDILLTGPMLSGAPAPDVAPLADWARRDPVRAELVPGLVLAESDVAGLARLQQLEAQAGLAVLPKRPAAEIMRAAWEAQADQPLNRLLPTRFQAWAAGVEAAWPRLDRDEREAALAILLRPEVPPPALFQKVIGTEDILLWLGGIDVPLSDAERAASPELISFMEDGAFANALRRPLIALRLAQAEAEGGPGLTPATEALMRLNAWSAASGEMHSWDAHRALTQGR